MDARQAWVHCVCRLFLGLTHWGPDKMVAILQTTFSNTFSWMEMFWFPLIFQVYSEGSNWQYISIGLDNGLAPNRRQAIIWTNDGLIYWCIYASLGLNELRFAGTSITKTTKICYFKINNASAGIISQQYFLHVFSLNFHFFVTLVPSNGQVPYGQAGSQQGLHVGHWGYIVRSCNLFSLSWCIVTLRLDQISFSKSFLTNLKTGLNVLVFFFFKLSKYFHFISWS